MPKLSTGNLIEIYLSDIDRFIYAKYIDTRRFIEASSFPFQFRIHNKYFSQPCVSPAGLDFQDLLFSPLHLTGFKPLINSGQWKIVGSQGIAGYDLLQHHYKMAWPPSLIALFKDVKQWRVLMNVNNVNEGQIVPYYRCAHLEYAENLGASYLSLRVLIEFFKQNGKAIEMDISNFDKFEVALYHRYTNMPLYAAVPDQFKGKVLPEDFVEFPSWLNTKQL